MEIKFNESAFVGRIADLHYIDLVKFYALVGQILRRSISKNFKEGGRYSRSAPIGTGGTDKWFDLMDTTKTSRKANKKWPGKIGSVTSQLVSSVVFQINKDGVFIGTNKAYAKAFHYGMDHYVPVTPKMRRFFWFMYYKTKDNMWRYMALTQKTEFHILSPPRPFIVVQEEDIARIQQELVRFVNRKFRE